MLITQSASATLAALQICCLSCVQAPIIPAIETQVSFLNLSRTQYVTFGIRAHDSGAAFVHTPLLAPGATQRSRFAALFHESCPGSIDLQVLLYRRIHRDIPIGEDVGEQVEAAPVVAAELDDVPACSVETLETYTIVNWDAPERSARVKIAQCSRIDDALRDGGRLGASGAWEVSGIDPTLATVASPVAAAISPIIGQVALADGSGVSNAVVLIRTRYRTALNCNASDDPSVTGYSEPITFAVTDAQGRFKIDRPAGVYRLEFFSDTAAFRPGQLDVETPRQDITVLAEGL